MNCMLYIAVKGQVVERIKLVYKEHCVGVLEDLSQCLGSRLAATLLSIIELQRASCFQEV